MSISNVNKLLNYMERVLEKAKAIPLTRFVVVDKEELLELMDRVREVLPKEIQEANNIIKTCEDRKHEAQNLAEQILVEAKKEADRLIDENEITKGARLQADKIKEDTNNARELIREKTVNECLKLKRQVINEAISIREGADKYAESIIRNLAAGMTDVQKMMLNVQNIVSESEDQLSKLRENSNERIAYYKSIVDDNELLLSKEQ